MAEPALPAAVGPFAVPQDEISGATWRWANRALPRYLLAHSVRSYAWGAALAARESWSFDARVLWMASLWHDIGLTRVPRNTTCFEFEGAELARRWSERAGLAGDEADRVAVAIVLHMATAVTLEDGVEAVLLDRATGIDVRGAGYALIDGVRRDVMTAFPRGDFDRHFLQAIEREVAVRPGCQSERLLRVGDLAGSMARSPWRIGPD